jgi:hypothetical protein
MANELFNIDVNPPIIYEQYAPLAPAMIPSVTNLPGASPVVTISGNSGQVTGPTIKLSGGVTGYSFTASGSNLTLTVSNAATARAAIGAAASGINTDISQLNGASQVDVSGVYKVAGTQVVSARGAAVPDAVGGANIDVEARAAINTLLARMRVHGLIS